MESNKDEAERCIDLAEKFILDGKYDKAEKFLQKSEKLYSTQKAKDLLDRVQRMQSASRGSNTSSTTQESNLRNRTNAGGAKEERNIEYTQEQLDLVKRIKKCKDYYEILGVTKDSTDSDIKKAYKKLALNLHPDKNHAPGSSEAFKAVGNAVAILTDPEKRKQYDLYGSDEDRANSMGTAHGHYASYSRGFESEMTAEEFFNRFFGGGFPTGGNVYVRRNHQWRRTSDGSQSSQHQRETNNLTTIMQILPLLILVGISMMSSFFVSDPVYSLRPSQKFTVVRHTISLKVPYYVKENFPNDYHGSIRRLESSVEEEYIINLRAECFREKTTKDNMMWRARSYGDADLFKKAQAFRTPSCESLQRINSKA